MTTAEAAKLLNLSRQRINALIKTGHLTATRGRYGAYILDEAEVKAFSLLDRGAGKPTPKPPKP